MKIELTLLITEIKISITRGENSVRQRFHKAKIPSSEISTLRTFRAAKFPRCEIIRTILCTCTHSYKKQIRRHLSFPPRANTFSEF